jgi:hypothetical protein
MRQLKKQNSSEIFYDILIMLTVFVMVMFLAYY